MTPDKPKDGSKDGSKEPAKLGKTQRLADLAFVDNLPRSHIGKVLKRELRDGYKGALA